MYLPLCVAEYLAQEGFTVRSQTSTRSPAYVLDEPGYPLRRGFEFPPRGDHSAKRYLYNAVVDAADPRGSQVVFVCDRPADTDELFWLRRPGRCAGPCRTQCDCGRGGYTVPTDTARSQGHYDHATADRPLTSALTPRGGDMAAQGSVPRRARR